MGHSGDGLVPGWSCLTARAWKQRHTLFLPFHPQGKGMEMQLHIRYSELGEELHMISICQLRHAHMRKDTRLSPLFLTTSDEKLGGVWLCDYHLQSWALLTESTEIECWPGVDVGTSPEEQFDDVDIAPGGRQWERSIVRDIPVLKVSPFCQQQLHHLNTKGQACTVNTQAMKVQISRYTVSFNSVVMDDKGIFLLFSTLKSMHARNNDIVCWKTYELHTFFTLVRSVFLIGFWSG